MEHNEFVIYNSQDGNIKVDVLFSDETVWLTIDQLCTLFGKSRSTVNEHILNVFSEKELSEEASMRKIGNSDFSTYCGTNELEQEIIKKEIFPVISEKIEPIIGRIQRELVLD